jgi:hypothetical protein
MYLNSSLSELDALCTWPSVLVLLNWLSVFLEAAAGDWLIRGDLAYGEAEGARSAPRQLLFREQKHKAKTRQILRGLEGDRIVIKYQRPSGPKSSKVTSFWIRA